MSTDVPDTHDTEPRTLRETLDAYEAELPADERPDGLHELFYGFYARVAVVDRTTSELATWAQAGVGEIEDAPAPMLEAVVDNAVHVGQRLFVVRMQTMSAMEEVSRRLQGLRADLPPDWTPRLRRALAYDQDAAELRSYALDEPGAHPDLPYDAFAYTAETAGAAAGTASGEAG